MPSTFTAWSKDRLAKCKCDWQRVEWWISGMGQVTRVNEGWEGRVNVGDRVGRISETFESAEVAMRAVERVWKREEDRRNAKLQPSGTFPVKPNW